MEFNAICLYNIITIEAPSMGALNQNRACEIVICTNNSQTANTNVYG